jgi:hypothetical protein
VSWISTAMDALETGDDIVDKLDSVRRCSHPMMKKAKSLHHRQQEVIKYLALELRWR